MIYIIVHGVTVPGVGDIISGVCVACCAVLPVFA